jgi:putative addiction module killer protein
MIEVRLYVDHVGRASFGRWFETLDATAAAKVTAAVARMEQGNLSNTKSVGQGVLEYRIDFGPGYRVYFGRDGDTVIVLVGGGTKKRQDRDIDAAKTRWADYKRRRREGR